MLKVVFTCALLAALPLATAGATDLSARYEALQAAASEDPAAWRALAAEAREAGDLATASRALERAAGLGLAPIPLGFERARQRLAAGDEAGAVGVLRGLVDGGFTGLQSITGDPQLGALAGNPAFDELVAELEVSAYPCAHQERFRAFDFWLGDWDVHTPNGTFAGSNRIRADQQGCVLIEEWQSVTGGRGHSINYLDAASDEWVQVWNDEGGSQIHIRGGMTEEGMLLVGKIHYVANGSTADFRGLWTPLPDGRVRQFFEQSSDGGASWTSWFEGFYSRRDSSDGGP